jgi:hypothetical protein
MTGTSTQAMWLSGIAVTWGTESDLELSFVKCASRKRERSIRAWRFSDHIEDVTSPLNGRGDGVHDIEGKASKSSVSMRAWCPWPTAGFH